MEVEVDPIGPASEEYVEDCSVCCRPWNVFVTREGEEVQISLERQDE